MQLTTHKRGINRSTPSLPRIKQKCVPLVILLLVAEHKMSGYNEKCKLFLLALLDTSYIYALQRLLEGALMTARIDFNCDMGESFGAYQMGQDEEIIKYITSANIACGFHAGDPNWMRLTVKLAEEHGVAIGAHPSFPDLAGFGRRNMAVAPGEAKNDIIYQMGALTAFTSARKLQHVKPHGAMYNMAVRDEALARAICEAILETDPETIMVALAGSKWVDIARDMGLRVAREAFADRAVNADGTLVPRSKPGSVIEDIDEVARRSVKMVTEGKVTAITGEEIALSADTLCLHGDTPNSLHLASSIRSALEAEGVQIVPLGRIVSR